MNTMHGAITLTNWVVRFMMVISIAIPQAALPVASTLASNSTGAGTEIPSSPVYEPRIFLYEKTFGETEVPYLADTNHLYFPAGVDVDSAGNLWIAEENGARVLKYASDGSFQFSIGKAGFSYEAGENSFTGPIEVAVDNSSNLWVVDSSSARVVKFNSAGIYQSQLGITWEAGTDNGHFDQPAGVAFDSHGNIYVSDWNNHRIQVFDSTGFYIETIGVTGVSGTDNSHLAHPVHITIDDADNLYVADAHNHRVQIFNASHVYAGTIGVSGVSGSGDDYLNTPRGVAVDANYIYIADSENHRIQVFKKADHSLFASLGHYGTGNAEFDWPTDIDVDSSGNIYVADLANHRVQKFNSSLAYVRTYGKTDVPYLTDGDHYNQPNDVAVDADGNIAIVEGWGRGERLIKLNASGVLQFIVGEAGMPGSDNDHFGDAFGVAFDDSGKIYVADCGNHRVQIFSSDGVWGATLGTGYGTGSTQFNCPAGVAFDSSGNIYVADANNHRIQIFDKERTYVDTLGTTGVEGWDNSHFRWPMDVEVDSQGNIYVADTLNHRVQKFNSSRVYEKTIGVPRVCGNDYQHFCEPWGLAIDSADNLYVAEKFNPRVQVFKPDGSYLATVGGKSGNQPGQFRELYGVAVDSQGNVYAADLFNYRIEKYAPGSVIFLPLTLRSHAE